MVSTGLQILEDCTTTSSLYEESIIERTWGDISKIGRKVSIIIFLAEKVNANYNTYKNGLINLSVIITIISFLNFTEPITLKDSLNKGCVMRYILLDENS